MNFILLTHARETQKPSNTGQLIRQLLPQTQTIIWQRTHPDERLLALIAAGKTALVYPSPEQQPVADVKNVENFILIDSTWQEARKIYNRSAYLHQLPRIQLLAGQTSSYTLRRNQIEDGLCTTECAIALLRMGSDENLAGRLEQSFRDFLL